MPLLMRPGRSRFRSIFIVVLILSSLGLSAVLAYQAQDAVRSHRATAESALRDYAAFAAWQYSYRLASELYYGVVWPALASMGEWQGDASFSSPTTLERLEKARQITREKDVSVAHFFHVDFRSGDVVWAGDPLPQAVQAWVRDTLKTHVQRVYGKKWEFAVLVNELGGHPRAVVYRPERDNAGVPLAAWGAVADLVVPDLYQAAYTHEPLLPATLMQGLPNDSVLSVAVSSPERRVLWMSSPQYVADSQEGFVRLDRLPPEFGGLLASVAIRPEAAGWLVIGGLPGSRLPLLLGLLLLTVGMVTGALWLMRQEYDLARLQAQFISGVSHELRTPLAQIRMFAETLLLGRVRTEGEQRRSLEIIDQESRRLAHLVDNVLQFSRAGRQVDTVAPEPQELGPIIREVVERFQPLAAARGVHVETDLEDGVIASVDTGALCQVLLNLLDNAVKYGPVGQTVRIALHTHYEWAQIRVDDQGPGVPRADRQRIWEAFGRLAREQESAVAGTGIGLAVVADLVERHDGRAWVTDAPEGGARFCVQLPLLETISDDDLESTPAHEASDGAAADAASASPAPTEPSTVRESA